ncbi:hypothetical protein [Caldicoprobacter faecalis]|uniref:ABC-2 family transporter protein n=1 Tax=Caldicoprobacter faecalis TaxID=937334 RepID=A0A1I5TCF9_9FIRM|nr:hypothetical protein [Caldicoprobacter faecalis]SFP80702.1 hypothetical protein SAMN05444406_10456 [Caldicoprobacter faecalis]
MLFNVLKTEFAKLLKRREFNIVLTIEVVLISILFILTSITYYKGYTSELPSAYQMWIGYRNGNFSFVGDIYYLFFLTLPASIAFADTYLGDKKERVLNFIVSRCNKSSYILSKGIVTFFSGFIVIFLPLLLNQLLCMVAFPLYTVSEVNGGNPAYDRYYLTRLYFQGLHTISPYLHNLWFMFLDGVFGGVVAIFSYAISFFRKVNRYTVVVLPTVLYFTQNFVFALLGNANYCLTYYLYPTTGVKGLDYMVFMCIMAVLLMTSIFVIILNARREEI